MREAPEAGADRSATRHSDGYLSWVAEKPQARWKLRRPGKGSWRELQCDR